MGRPDRADRPAQKGRPTFEDVYREHLDHVWHSLRRLGVPDSDREDLAHDVFLVVRRRLDSYRPDASLRAWLFGIAYRVVADHRRLARHRREVLSSDAGADAAAADDAAAQRALLANALAALPLVRRAVFVLADIDGHSAPEIAEILAIPPNTVYSHLRRARRELAARVRVLTGEGGAS